MNREEVTLLGFEIVAYAGDARSKLLEALKAAEAGDFAKAVEELDDAEWYFGRAKKCIERGLPTNLMRYERSLRERINRAIGAIPGFRDSEEFKKLIELYPTYKEIEQ